MGQNEISRITMELEDLLMKEETKAVGNYQEQNKAEQEPALRRERKRKREIRLDWGLLAAFLVPMVVLLILFVQRGIYPFGDKSFLRTDMYHQYAPFFSEFRDKLKQGGSLLYSWNIGLGVNFTALYAYYLASPLNWLLVFCPGDLVIEFMTYMIVLKTGLSGLTMAWYLRKHCRTDCFGVAFFGIFYALSGYMAAYSWNIMWLDCIILFPVVMLGLERLVSDGDGLLYGISLGLSILSNYYISIMTCIFMVIYFIALLVLEEEMDWEFFMGRVYRFAGYSLIAGGMAAVLLLPEMNALKATASGTASFPKTFTQYFTIIDMAARHIGNVSTEIGLDHWPNIYCGVAVLMFVPMYLLSDRIPVKEKAVYCVLLLFLFASFSMNVLNFIWHGFHYPNSLPCRQSYIYIVLVLTMCCRVYTKLDDLKDRTVMHAFWGAVIFVIAAQKLVTAKHFHFVVFYVALLFLALYLGIIFFYRKGYRYQKAALYAGLLLVSVESAVNMGVTSITTVSRTDYIQDNKAVEALVDSVSPSDGFFRVEKVSRKTKNDGAWMHFPSVSLFSSTAHADLTEFLKKLGCESSTNAYSITGSTPLVDSLLAVRYALYSEDPPQTGLKEYRGEQDPIRLYENTTALPLGFVVNPDFESRWDLGLNSPADVQNSLSDALDAEQVLILDPGVTDHGSSVTMVPTENGDYYAFIGNKKIEKVSLTTASRTKTFDHVDRGYLLELGYCFAGEEITLSAEGSSESLRADLYRFSEEGMRSVYQRLNENPWRLSSWTDTSLKGTADSPEGGTLLTTIPYDEGWTITVDGTEQPAQKMLGAFIGIPLSSGIHEIEMQYMPKGLKTGAVISAAALLLLVLAAYLEHLLRCRALQPDEEWDEEPPTDVE